MFQLHGNTNGWVGMGISPNGGMTGADIVIGWVENGNIVIEVRVKYNLQRVLTTLSIDFKYIDKFSCEINAAGCTVVSHLNYFIEHVISFYSMLHLEIASQI